MIMLRIFPFAPLSSTAMRYLRHVLWPIAIIYGAIVAFRNLLFDVGILSSTSFNVPIISVGNLEMGGTGKSPLVLHICKLLLDKGVNVAVLSRGYGRKSSGFLLVNETNSSNEVGDEPLQVKHRFPGAKVAVCERRGEGIERLLAMDSPPDVIVLDDAFQHRWVKPSLSILTTPAPFPFWKKHLFPVGSLREWTFGAKRANALVLTGSFEEEENVPFDGAVFHCQASIQDIVHFSGKNIDLKKDDAVVLLSGIAHPERFVQSASLHYSILGSQLHADHHEFTQEDIKRLLQLFHSFGVLKKAILITEKDAARLRNSLHLEFLKETPVYVAQIGLNWKANHEQRFNQILLHHAESNT